MAGKHNTRHSRGKSHYPQRLKKRGETNVTVRMPSLEQLRQWQHAEEPTVMDYPAFNGKRNNWRRRDED